MINEYFTQAELSLAAYATLSVGIPDKAMLKEAGMSDSQAAHFASTFAYLPYGRNPFRGHRVVG